MSVRRERTLSILVVEDDHAVAELMRQLLNGVPGWGATVVHDASAACEVFKNVRIEALVVDVNLPGISGIELLHLLRKDPSWHEPGVLMVSANPDQPAVRDAMRTRLVTHFLSKPFDVDDLIVELSKAVTPQS
jgi:CheY-like chemotaxis protein